MFIGEVAPVPLGFLGLTGNKNMATVGAEQLIEARNISYFDGTISKEGGAERYNEVVLGGVNLPILGGWDWWPSDGVQRMVIFHQVAAGTGAFLKDDGSAAFGDTLAGALTVNASTHIHFVEGGAISAAEDRKLFMYSGTNQMKVLAGDDPTAADVASPPADWASSFPITGDLHDNRHFAAGNLSDPHRVYYTPANDHENFSGTLSVYPGEGERIVCVKSFRKGRLLVFKNPKGIYLVDTTDATPANWLISRLSKGVGMCGPGGLVDLDEDLLFMDPAGYIHLLSAVREYGDFGFRSFSEQNNANMDTFVRDNIRAGSLAKTQSVFYSAKREVHFTVGSKSTLLQDRRLVIDFNNLENPRFRFSDRDENRSIWLRRDDNLIPRPVWGTEESIVYLGDTENKSLRTGAIHVGYLAQFATGQLDMSHHDPELAAMRKNFHFLELLCTPLGNWTVFCDIYVDAVLKKTISFNMGTSGATLGSFLLDTDALAGDQAIRIKRRLSVSGNRIQLVFRNEGASEDFSIALALIHFTRAGHRVGR
jgi:hypothetical protein